MSGASIVRGDALAGGAAKVRGRDNADRQGVLL